ncbi:MAG: rhombosortase, partial [Candidatus Methylomirabilis sp.]
FSTGSLKARRVGRPRTAALPGAATRLQYDRAAIAAGELWRILSGHWTHVSADHLFWNVLAFVVLGAIGERSSRVRFYTCLVGSAVVIPVALWTALPQLRTYRGLSGIDSALFALLAVTLMKDVIHARRWTWVTGLSAVFLAFIGKVGFEMATGRTIFVDSTAAHMLPVPLAHCIGAVVGVIVGMTGYCTTRCAEPRSLGSVAQGLEDFTSSALMRTDR